MLKTLFEIIIPKNAQHHLNKVVQQWIGYPKQRHMKNFAEEFPKLYFLMGLLPLPIYQPVQKMIYYLPSLFHHIQKMGKMCF